MTEFFPNPAAGVPFPQVAPLVPPNGQGISPFLTILQAMATGQLPAQTIVYNSGPQGNSIMQLLSDGVLSASALTSTLQFAPTYTITNVSQASSAVVTISSTAAANPMTVGQTAYFSGVVGMTQINNQYGTITATGGSSGAWTATVNIASTSYTAYSSGGTLQVGETTYAGN
jgi:hypothetical protein